MSSVPGCGELYVAGTGSFDGAEAAEEPESAPPAREVEAFPAVEADPDATADVARTATLLSRNKDAMAIVAVRRAETRSGRDSALPSARDITDEMANGVIPIGSR